MATSEEIEKLRDALRRFSAGGSGVSYLGEEGVRELIRLVTNRIEASGGGGSSWVPEPGAYVAYTDADGANRIAKPSEYKSEGNTPCGVLVVHGGGSLLVSLTAIYNDDNNLRWDAGRRGEYTAGYMTSDLDTALRDMDGQKNSTLFLLSGLYGTSYIGNSIWWKIPYNEGWWIPSMGELKVINDNYDAIDEALAACGGTPLYEYNDYMEANDFRYVSSTLYSDSQIWSWSLLKKAAYTDAGCGGIVRPVSRFAWVPDGYSGGGEPEYVEPEPEPEPITVVPDTVLRPYGANMQEFTLMVTSPTPWAIPKDNYFDENGGWDNGNIYIPQTSGPAGVTEIQGSGYFEKDVWVFANLTFEDELGNSAKVKIDSTEGICAWPEYLEFSEKEGVYNKSITIYSPTNWTSETEGDSNAFDIGLRNDDAGTFTSTIHCNDLSEDAECVQTFKDKNGNTAKVTFRVRN